MNVTVTDALIALRTAPDNWGDGQYLLACALVLADEVDHLRAELTATQETLRELGDAWEEAAPMLDAALRDHPSAKPAALYVIKTDT